jgi:hypothetical protein
MINQKELAVCKRRGHDPQGRCESWERCKYCGMWTRTIRTMEERKDDPPENEQDPMYRLQRLTACNEELNRASGRPPGRPSRATGKKK